MLESTFDKKIGKNLELKPSSNKKIVKNLYKELGLTLTNKISRNLNKKLWPSFTYSHMYLKKKTAILIIKINNKVYKLKTYNEIITNLIYCIRC